MENIHENDYEYYKLKYLKYIYIYDEKILKNVTYYDLIVKERLISFDTKTILITYFYDIDNIFLKLYTNKSFDNILDLHIILERIMNSEFINIIKASNIKKESTILKFDNFIIKNILGDMKKICDIFINNNIKDFNTTKIIKFCLYIFEIYFRPVHEFNLDKII